MATPMIHQTMPVLHIGAPLEQAKHVMILVHGRGAGAGSMIPLAEYLSQKDWAFLVPQAAENTWYPQRFIMPRRSNEPYLSSALAILDQTVQKAQAFVGLEHIMLLGFSQGACLTLEYAARHPQPYGGVVALSGGLIGTDEELTGYEDNALAGVPIFLGCSDTDWHIPLERVQRSTQILRQMGAKVDERIYPGMDHTINRDEVDAVRAIMTSLR
ncbi:MAG: alpha/beta fold hydrolase [Anaerolineae bacterium]|nr:alpha/beta fold hydrolase [Anaerolineae bacterium]MDW8171439.1 alpha/beta fold hydrolase [Anaerolineae bacterium]